MEDSQPVSHYSFNWSVNQSLMHISCCINKEVNHHGVAPTICMVSQSNLTPFTLGLFQAVFCSV